MRTPAPALRPQVRSLWIPAARLYVRARRYATGLLAAAVALGILVMLIHWS
jgi:hypothetical protein